MGLFPLEETLGLGLLESVSAPRQHCFLESEEYILASLQERKKEKTEEAEKVTQNGES